MKRIITIFFVSFLVFFSYAQNNSLYDVNYDKPIHTLSYDESLQSFQNIYLQYESAIQNIHETEKNNSLKEKQVDRQQFNVELEEALKKQREEIYATEVEILRNKEREKLANELREEISLKLTEQYTTEYENKKNEAVKLLEKELRDKISLENENLKVQYKTEIRNELESEYENKKNEEVKLVEEELHNKISLENEGLKEQYKTEVRNELESEYINKKNEELKVLSEQQYKQILEETNATTERFKIVMSYIAGFFIIAVIILLIKFSMKIFKAQKGKKIEKKKWEDLVHYFADGYLNELKQYDGKTAVFEAIKKIRKDIENSTEPDSQKMIRRLAIGEAEEKYKKYKATLPINEYKKLFSELDAGKIFKQWNSSGEDLEFKKGLCNNFISQINEYTELATEAYNSNNNKADIATMFKIYVKTLENRAEQVDSLAQSESNTEIKNNLISISEKYKELAKKFAKGEF